MKLWDHQTERRQNRADGTWQTVCVCGWRSAPAGHHDELGWVCGREQELLSLAERLAAADTTDPVLGQLVHEAQVLVGGAR